MLVGQDKLKNLIAKYSQVGLPKTLMFIGDRGCGKHSFAKYMAQECGLEYVELTADITSDDLSEIQFSTIKTLYTIDLDSFSLTQQNQLLKFIEEPSEPVYILLLTSAESTVLPTVLNRCIKVTFEQYSVEQLQYISKNAGLTDPRAYEIFRTPGKIISLTNASFSELMNLAEKVVHKIKQASYPNALLVSTRINYKDLYDKIDFYLFFDAIEYVAFEDFKNNKNLASFEVFKITNQFRQLTNKKMLIKEVLVLNYLTTLWEALHDFKTS